MALQVNECFGLDVISYLLEGFRVPGRAFDPESDWRGHYSVYTLGGRGQRAGNLAIRREGLSEGRFALHVSYGKLAPGHVQRTEARMVCKADHLATPVEWTVCSQVNGPEGAVLANTRLDKKGRVSEKGIVVEDVSGRRTLEVSGGHTINWALFEAVRRLRRESFEPIGFTLIDDFDQVKGEQVLSYRGRFEVVIGEKAVGLFAYDHVGRGVVPWVFWVDERGRLLFAVSGIEAYILDIGAMRRGERVNA